MKKLQLIVYIGGLTMSMGSVLVAASTTLQAPTTNSKNTSNKHSKSTIFRTNKKNLHKKLKRNAIILVTIDGGSATKKSPIAKSLAEKFDLIYVESGAIYRTVAHVLLKHKMKPELKNKQKIEDFLKNVNWKITIRNRHACFVVDGEFLSDKELRSAQLNTTVASYASQFESVHNFCLKLARKSLDYIEIEGFKGVIAEGRTCGTKTFPEADLKFWFNTSKEAKIDFRLKKEKEVDDPLQRDALDGTSPFAPLRKPNGAICIWTHNRSIAKNIRLASAFIEQKLDEKNELTQPENK
ncbi:MAG: (d)CMP kinase [Puniceicoccales bacterium]|nr:(d)CMP kinase [Puniceicoccales bacterium]